MPDEEIDAIGSLFTHKDFINISVDSNDSKIPNLEMIKKNKNLD